MYVLSAAIYVGGAIGLEMVGAQIYTGGGNNSVHYLLFSSIEEVMEMLGIILVWHTNLQYLQTTLPGLTLGISTGAPSPTANEKAGSHEKAGPLPTHNPDRASYTA